MTFIFTKSINGLEILTSATPSSSFWPYMPSSIEGISVIMRTVTFTMRKRNILQIPEQFNTNSLPWVFMFDSKLLNGLNLFFTPEAIIFTEFLEQVKQNHFS